MATNHPLFRYRYLDRSKLHDDSPRFRTRLAASFPWNKDDAHDIAVAMKREAGIVVPMSDWGYLWEEFWTEAELADVLTAITVAIIFMTRKYPSSRAPAKFRDAVKRAMVDEHLGLRIDDDGLIHLGVDETYEADRLATLAGLDDERLKDARNAYEAAHHFMDGSPPDTRAAVRSAFECVEIIARQLAPAHKNLHVNLCKGDLKAKCLPVLSSDSVEQKMLGYLFDSMGEWVSGLHFYRHGQPESASPSVDSAVLVLTTASGYARLLARVAVQALPK